MRCLGLDQSFLLGYVSEGREEIPWAIIAEVLVLSRLCHPSSELHIAEYFFEQTALSDLLEIPRDKINEDRLYRTLDQVLP